MDLNRQVFRAPSIPKIGRRNVSSSAIRGALKPQIKLNRSTFSFIKPTKKEIDVEKISKVSVEKNISVEATLGETNRILVEIQKQLALDFGYRITEEKKALAAERKRIAAQKVSDKEASIEKGQKGILGKTFDKVVAPFKSIFQKLIDFFSIILTGILLNTAFKWLSNKENRKKLKQFFDFIKEYWQELLIIFAAYKLARLVGKIFNIAKNIKNFLGGFKKILDMLKKSPQGLCNCASSLPDCNPIQDCVENLIKDPKRGPGFLNNLANALLTTAVFKNFIPLLPGKKRPTAPSYYGPGGDPTGTGLGQAQQRPNMRPIRQPPISQPTRQPANQPVSSNRGFWGGLIDLAKEMFSETYSLKNLDPKQNPNLMMNMLLAQQFSNLSSLPPGADRLIEKLKLLNKVNPRKATTLKGQFDQLKPRDRASMDAIRDIEQEAEKDLVRFLTGKNPSKITPDELIQIVKNQKYKAPVIQKSEGGTIPGFSIGGTVGGKGSGLVDTIPAMLAAGEEVIRTSMAMMWRPLLKDINDNGAKLWMSFQRGTLKQDLNNKINYELNVKLMGLLKELLEIVSIDTKRIQKNKNRGGGRGSGGGWMGDSNMVNPFRNPKQWYNLGRNARIPNESTASWKQLIKDDFQQVGKFKTPTGYKGFNPLWSFTKGLGTGPTPIQRQLVERSLRSLPKLMKFGGAAAGTLMDMAFPEPALNPTLDDARKMGLLKYDRPRNLQRPKRQAKVNVINLPPETVSVGPKPGSLKLPSSGEATTVPSISPFDASNAYIAFTPDEYGMVM